MKSKNQYGEISPQQEKALEALILQRNMVCLLEEESEYGGRAYLEKQDFIIVKQKEQLVTQERKLEDLTMKIEDVEALINEVAEIAYDKAVELVTNTVIIETHKEDIRLVEQSKAWVLSQERKASKKVCEYAAI